MVNQAVQTLLNRRSVRSFDSRQITPEQLEVLTRIAADSPTARNLQRCHFTVVQDQALLEHMAELIRQQMLQGTEEQKKKASAPGYTPLYHAPTLIFVNGSLSSSFHVHTDCGIAAGLIVAAAQEMGLATCVIASSLFMFQSPEGEQLKKTIQLPEGYQTVCTVAVGYPKGELPAPPSKRDPKEFTAYIG